MKFRVIKIYVILRNLFKINHWRGYGIHSPFMYRFVREVIVKRSTGAPLPDMIDHYLLKQDIDLLSNLYGYLGYDKCIVAAEGIPSERTLCIAPNDASINDVKQLFDNDLVCCCVAVMGVNKSHDKYKFCRQIIKSKDCVSVDLYRTYIFFFDDKLQKQYYKIRK